MHYKFHDENDAEVWVTDPSLFAQFVSAGKIKPDTLLFDAQTSLWKRAWEFDDYHRALAAINSGAAGYQATPLYGGHSLGASQDGSILFNPPSVDDKSDRIWPLALSVFILGASVVLVMITGFKFAPSAARAGYRMGVVLGGSAWIGLLAFLIWRFALKKSKGMGWLIFAGGVMLLSISQAVMVIREGQTTKYATQDIAATIQKLVNGDQMDADEINEMKYGDLAPMVKIIRDNATAMQADLQEMNQEMENLHLETLLNKDTLQNSATIQVGQSRLDSMREMLDRYETKIRARAEDIPRQVTASNMSESEKQSFIAGFNTTKEQGLRDISEFFAIERSLADKAGELFYFMEGKQGRYKISGDQPVFSSQSDVEAYNKFIYEIRQVAQQENDWRMRQISRSQEKIREFQQKMNQR